MEDGIHIIFNCEFEWKSEYLGENKMDNKMMEVLITAQEDSTGDDFEDLIISDEGPYLTFQKLFPSHNYTDECTIVKKTYYEHVKSVLEEFYKIQEDLLKKYQIQCEKFKIKEMIIRKNELLKKVKDMNNQILKLDDEISKRKEK